MVNRYVVEQVTSYFGLVFWSLQLAPQVWKTYRRGTSTGVSAWTMLVWSFAGMLMGVYNIGLDVAIALWIQPALFTLISCICLSQEFRYEHKWSKRKTFIGYCLTILFLGGLEAGLIFAFKKAQQVQNQGAIRLFGILPVIFVIGGFLPQYYEIFRDKRVYGISHVFLCMDTSGSVFSIVSLVYGDSIDALDLVSYIAIACLDIGILVLYYFFEWYHKKFVAQEGSVTEVNSQKGDIEEDKVAVASHLPHQSNGDGHDTKSSTSLEEPKTTS